MAFGFLKKIVAAITGKKADQKQKGQGQQGGKGRRGKRGGKGGQQQNGRNQQQQQGRRGDRQNGQQQGGNRSPQNQQGQPGPRNERRNNRQGGRGRRDDRRGDRSRRGPAPVNTAAGEMRPGGEISAEELAARQAAHAAWDPATFVVEPAEGKKRFHGFDLPSEVMHGICDLGFK